MTRNKFTQITIGWALVPMALCLFGCVAETEDAAATADVAEVAEVAEVVEVVDAADPIR